LLIKQPQQQDHQQQLSTTEKTSTTTPLPANPTCSTEGNAHNLLLK
jgi:hypothetical protein